MDSEWVERAARSRLWSYEEGVLDDIWKSWLSKAGIGEQPGAGNAPALAAERNEPILKDIGDAFHLGDRAMSEEGGRCARWSARLNLMGWDMVGGDKEGCVR